MCLTELTILRVRSRSPIRQREFKIHPSKHTQERLSMNQTYYSSIQTRPTMRNDDNPCADSPLLAWFHGVAPFHQTAIKQRNNVCYNPPCFLAA